MQVFITLAALLVAASAQEYIYPREILFGELPPNPQYYEEIDPSEVMDHGLRIRRDVKVLPGEVTWDKSSGPNRVFGTLGQNDNGLFGKAGVERNIFNDGRGNLNGQLHGTRTLGPYGDSSSFGGALNWKNSNAAASIEANKQIHGPTSLSAAAGGRWKVGKNGDIGVDGTYSRTGGMKNYGAQGVFNYRW